MAEDTKTPASGNISDISDCIANLSGPSRLARQRAATQISSIAKDNPKALGPYMDDMVDALNRPEAHTRWRILEALTQMVPVDSKGVAKAFDGAETALYDEDSGTLRLCALRFLCKLGATTQARSAKVWPLIDETILCCHGDSEFQDMLVAIAEFSQGNLAKSVKDALAERMQFDAANGKGALQKQAAAIIENLKD